MINFNDYTIGNSAKIQNENRAEIKVAIYSRLSLQNIHNRRFWIRKTDSLSNLINNQPDIDKTYLYAISPYEAKYQCLINKRESVGLKNCNDAKAFIEYSNHVQDVYKNIE